jgi:TonB family protein
MRTRLFRIVPVITAILLCATAGSAATAGTSTPASTPCPDSTAQAAIYATLPRASAVTRPARLRKLHGRLHTPRSLLGVAGRVVVRVVVDTLGHISPCSMTLVSSTNAGFVQSAFDALANAEFVPAEQDGHLVAVWLEVPVAFSSP